MINSRRLSAVEDFCTDHYLLKIDSAHIFNSLAASDEWKSDAADPLHKSPIPDPVLPEKLRWHLQTSSIPYVVQGPQLVFAFSGILFEGFEAQGSTVLRANGTVRIRKELKQRVAAVLNDVHQHYVVGRWAVSDEGYVSLVARVSEEVEEASDGALDWGLVRMQQAMEDVVPQLQPFVAHAEQVGDPRATFPYPCGTKIALLEWFDVSDDACQAYGFRHGDRVRDPEDGHYATVIGVRAGDGQRRRLWFHADVLPGAGVYDPRTMARLQRVGSCVVERAA